MASDKPNFDTIINFRDVGETVNRVVGRNVMQTGKLYRAARPDEASALDRKKLVEDYGIKHIIDLRTKTEHIEQAKKHKALVASSAAVPQSNSQTAQPLKIPGVTYHDINFNGDAYSKSLLSQLTWPQYLKLISLMVVGKRTEGIAVLGENVMRPRGLIGLALDSLAVCTAEVKEVFSVFSNPENYPLLIHCTQGKDRTGLTVMLALFLLGVPEEAIERDYMMSQERLVSERQERLEEIRAIGLDDSFAGCDEGMVDAVRGFLDGKGGVEAYLESCGVEKGMREGVKELLGIR